jgi:hypothetical protein
MPCGECQQVRYLSSKHHRRSCLLAGRLEAGMANAQRSTALSGDMLVQCHVVICPRPIETPIVQIAYPHAARAYVRRRRIYLNRSTTSQLAISSASSSHHAAKGNGKRRRRMPGRPRTGHYPSQATQLWRSPYLAAYGSLFLRPVVTNAIPTDFPWRIWRPATRQFRQTKLPKFSCEGLGNRRCLRGRSVNP